jgi:hypothetical protein
VLIFVNGWNMGSSSTMSGRSASSPCTAASSITRATTTLALAVWSADNESGGLGDVALEVLGNYATAPP